MSHFNQQYYLAWVRESHTWYKIQEYVITVCALGLQQDRVLIQMKSLTTEVNEDTQNTYINNGQERSQWC